MFLSRLSSFLFLLLFVLVFGLEEWKADYKWMDIPVFLGRIHEENQNQPMRKSPSPTHHNFVSHSHVHLRPGMGVYAHQRRDSDTLRNAPSCTSSSAQSNLATSSSPTVVDNNNRLSPSSSGRGLSGSQGKHRRSPTAPEPGTTSGMLANGSGKGSSRNWSGAGEESEFGGESEREGGGMSEREGQRVGERERGKGTGTGTETVRPPPPRPSSALQGNGAFAGAVGPAPVANRHLYVRIRIPGPKELAINI